MMYCTTVYIPDFLCEAGERDWLTRDAVIFYVRKTANLCEYVLAGGKAAASCHIVTNSRRWYLKRDAKRIVKGTVLISRRSVNCKLKVSNGQARGSACFIPKKPVLRAFKMIHLSEATRRYGSYFVGCGTESFYSGYPNVKFGLVHSL